MKIQEDIRVLQVGSEHIYHNLGPLPRMVFDPDGIMGFEDTADIRRESTPRPVSHGDFSTPGYYAGKLITITGYALANHTDELHEMRDRVAGLFNSGLEQWVSVSTLNSTRYVKASQGSGLSWEQLDDVKARWKVDLYLADPRMYSVTKYAQIDSASLDTTGLEVPIAFPISFGTQEAKRPTLVNLGNSEAWPIFKVNANLVQGFTITNGTTKYISFTGETFAGSEVVIDTYKGTATVNGVDRSYQLGRRDWFSIPANSSIKPKFTPRQESNAWADVEWQDTWV